MAEFFQKALRQAMREGTVPSIPDKIIVFGHFIRGDLATFSDFWARKREFRGLGKTIVSGRMGHALDLVAPGSDGNRDDDDDDEAGPSRPRPVHLRALDGRQFRVRIRFIDTNKLTPGQRGLAYVGVMNGMPKLDLHVDLGIKAEEAAERPECVGLGLPARYGKDRMDLVMRDFPDVTERYAFRDAEITLAHGIMVEKLAREQFKLRWLPSTIAGCAAAMVRDLSGGSAALAALMGRTIVTQTRAAGRDSRSRASVRRGCGPAAPLRCRSARACMTCGTRTPAC